LYPAPDRVPDSSTQHPMQSRDAGPETSDNDSDGKSSADKKYDFQSSSKAHESNLMTPAVSAQGQQAQVQSVGEELSSSSSSSQSVSSLATSPTMPSLVTAAPPKVSGSLLSRSRPSLSPSLSVVSGNLVPPTITMSSIPPTSDGSQGASSLLSTTSQSSTQCPFCLRRCDLGQPITMYFRL